MFNYRIEDCVEPLKHIYHGLKNINNSVVLLKPLLGSIFWCDLGSFDESVQGGIRPCVVFNNFAQSIQDLSYIVPLTSSLKSTYLPIHVVIKSSRLSGLRKDSMALCEQMRSVKNDSLLKPLGILTYNEFCDIDNAMKIESPFPTEGEDKQERAEMLKKYFDMTIPVVKKFKGI